MNPDIAEMHLDTSIAQVTFVALRFFMIGPWRSGLAALLDRMTMWPSLIGYCLAALVHSGAWGAAFAFADLSTWLPPRRGLGVLQVGALQRVD